MTKQILDDDGIWHLLRVDQLSLRCIEFGGPVPCNLEDLASSSGTDYPDRFLLVYLSHTR